MRFKGSSARSRNFPENPHFALYTLHRGRCAEMSYFRRIKDLISSKLGGGSGITSSSRRTLLISRWELYARTVAEGMRKNLLLSNGFA